MSGYDAVIFDMDGVLVERSPSWVFEEATADAFAAFDIDPEEANREAFRSVAALSEGESERLERQYGIDLESLWATRERLAAVNQFQAIETGEKAPYNGVDVLAELDLPAGLVSNNSHQAVEVVLSRFGLDRHLEVWFGLQPTLADARRAKPDATYLDLALDRLDAERAVYVGDRETDILAAENANIHSAFVHRNFNDDEEMNIEPTYELDSLTDLPRVVGEGCCLKD